MRLFDLKLTQHFLSWLDWQSKWSTSHCKAVNIKGHGGEDGSQCALYPSIHHYHLIDNIYLFIHEKLCDKKKYSP